MRALIVLALVTFVAVSHARAQPRRAGPGVDRAFGRDGAVALRVPSTVDPLQSFVPNWVLVDAVANRSGQVYVLWDGLGSASAVLAAYDAEGRLDRAFGHDGVLALGALGGFEIAIDSVGRVVVLGDLDHGDSNSPGAVVLRVLPDGRLDPAFGFGGVQRRASPGLYPWDILSDGSGGVLVLERSSSTSLTALFRLDPDGVLDRNYGEDGFAVVPRMGEGDLRAHTVDATGRFTAVDAIEEVVPAQVALVGLDAAGRPDAALGEQGIRLLDLGPGAAGVADVGIDEMDRWVVLGHRDRPNQAHFIARYLADGTPDATWSGTADGVRDVLVDGTLPGTLLSKLTIDGESYYADGTRYGPHGRHWGDSVVVRVDDGGERVWTSRTRRFKYGLDVLSVRDGALLAVGDDRTRRRPGRGIPSFLRLRFD